MPKAALVTGGTGRVGSSIAARLRAEGFEVLAAGRKDGDLARPEEARELVARCARELGSLDVLVNAAADGFWPRGVGEVTEADWDAAFGATAKGSFFVTQAAAPYLRRSPVALVVMIEDVASYQAWPSFTPHCAAKAAQAMLRRTLARALAPEVRVCGVAPGAVAVPPELERRYAAEAPLGRIGSPEDIADAVSYLLEARFVTGSTIVVDGGRLLGSAQSAEGTIR